MGVHAVDDPFRAQQESGMGGQSMSWNTFAATQSQQEVAQQVVKQSTKETPVFSIYGELKQFIKEHRGVLFTLVFVILLDKYLFEGALRERLKGVINGLLSKAEKIATKE